MPEAITQQGPPHDLRSIWVSTRKAGPVEDGLASNVVKCYLLQELMASVKLPLDELSTAHLVAIEIPPVALGGFEHTLLHLITKIRAIGPHVAIILQPNLQGQAQQAQWVHRWNKIDQRPFQLIQTCTCKLGNKCQGCHLPLTVGITFEALLEPCSQVPTLGAQSLTVQSSLRGALLALPALLTNTPRHHLRCSCQRPHKRFAALGRQLSEQATMLTPGLSGHQTQTLIHSQRRSAARSASHPPCRRTLPAVLW